MRGTQDYGKKKPEKGMVNYKLHCKFLAKLDIAPRPRKFWDIQYWHLTRDNVLLVTAEEREAEHCARMSSLVSPGKRKHNDDP